jgi:glycosyltransferase involved in cell wall biosynthesis
MLPVPPSGYAGTERVIAAIGEELHRRGHVVGLVAPGDSRVPYELIASVPRGLWSEGELLDVAGHLEHSIEIARAEAGRYDVVHAHLEGPGILLAASCRTPVLSTLHRRLDGAGMPALLDAHRDVPLVAVSDSQRRWFPRQRWMATIHHGLPLLAMPFSPEPGDYLAFVGRATEEKGLREAIELSRQTGVLLRAAAKVLDEHSGATSARCARQSRQPGQTWSSWASLKGRSGTGSLRPVSRRSCPARGRSRSAWSRSNRSHAGLP